MRYHLSSVTVDSTVGTRPTPVFDGGRRHSRLRGSRATSGPAATLKGPVSDRITFDARLRAPRRWKDPREFRLKLEMGSQDAESAGNKDRLGVPDASSVAAGEHEVAKIQRLRQSAARLDRVIGISDEAECSAQRQRDRRCARAAPPRSTRLVAYLRSWNKRGCPARC